MASEDGLDIDRLLAVSNFSVRVGDVSIGCRAVGPIRVVVAAEGRSDGHEACVPTVTLRRALTDSTLFHDWCRSAAAGEPAARDVVVEQLDRSGKPTGVGWKLVDAEPVAWSGPAFDALTDAVSEETLELRYRSVDGLS